MPLDTLLVGTPDPADLVSISQVLVAIITIITITNSAEVRSSNSMNEVMPFIWLNFPVHDNVAVKSTFFSMNCLYCSRDVLRPIFCGWRQSWRQSWSAPSRGCRSPLSPSLESCLLCPGLLLPGWRCLSHPNNLKVMQLLMLVLMIMLILMIMPILIMMLMLFTSGDSFATSCASASSSASVGNLGKAIYSNISTFLFLKTFA